jgi:hypothetical protein
MLNNFVLYENINTFLFLEANKESDPKVVVINTPPVIQILTQKRG